MRLTALGNRIVVKRIETQATRTAGGIYLPQTAEDPRNNVYMGEVLAKGPDADSFTKTVVNVGDIVQYQRDGSFPFFSPEDGEEYAFIHATNVWASYPGLAKADIKDKV